jgi:hypothetical protein
MTFFARSIPIVVAFIAVAPSWSVVDSQLHFGTLMPHQKGATIPLASARSGPRERGRGFLKVDVAGAKRWGLRGPHNGSIRLVEPEETRGSMARTVTLLAALGFAASSPA